MCPLPTRCHMPAHQVASHELVGRAKPYLRIRQTHNREMFTIVLEVNVWKDLIGLMQADQPHSGGGLIIPIKSFSYLIKWQQLDTVWHLGNGHVVANLANQPWVCGIVKHALALYHSQVGTKVLKLGVWFPHGPSTGPPPFVPLSFCYTDH